MAGSAKQLTSQLWDMANALRGKMDASMYQNYILGFIFYRYLSEYQEHYLVDSGLLDVRDSETVNAAYVREATGEELDDWRENLSDELGYAIDPEYTWESLIGKIQNQTLKPEDFQEMLIRFNRNTQLNKNAEADFSHVFDDINLNDSKLGNNTNERAKSLATLMDKINGIQFIDDNGHDILGDVYEYLIAEFAGNSGKKAGEFYTPHEVSRILAKLVSYGREKDREVADEFSVYDPTMGSGSLLLTVESEMPQIDGNKPIVQFYGQELNSTTFNLARMNLMMHSVRYDRMTLRNADTLEMDWPDSADTNGIDYPLLFDGVVANPPYSQHWDNNASKMKDPRFKDYGKLAPKTKADYAFVEHGLYHLKDTGRMAIVLPHGVLFRGAAEGTIRKAIIDKNYLDAVIGLPANLFYSTGIPTVVLVFAKNRTNTDVLFIDASKDFEKNKNRNHLREEDIDKIIKTYGAREDVEKYAHVATLDEIKENDYNLNIPRYVDTFEEEEPIDINEVNRQLAEVDKEIADLTAQFEAMIADLVWTDPEKHKNDHLL
ncbi:type I restriction-modification system subunit M [Bifidobacterium choloepi]|uniref:site-specific DNA-methyltransferase (adenine-specific) n=1 Tax=Bifidobacterium choloepi TaxID=2614131 RepID=A0A6I5N611_9BIFI|nr:type I restriction-modification system subunit M [Bifidobacterium choloepi]NEG69221.1 type I restriction-modification system subunit M [Bifidobacterium choloepi]